MTTQEVWTLYSKDLNKFIRSKVKDDAITEDILQDSFIKIHTKLHTLRDLNKLKSWIYSIAKNSIIDYFKSRNQTFEIANFEPEIEIEQEPHSEKDCLRGILSGLPKKYRDPIFLSDIKGLKQAEVAKQLNIPLATAKSQVQRARKKIARSAVINNLTTAHELMKSPVLRPYKARKISLYCKLHRRSFVV